MDADGARGVSYTDTTGHEQQCFTSSDYTLLGLARADRRFDGFTLLAREQ